MPDEGEEKLLDELNQFVDPVLMAEAPDAPQPTPIAMDDGTLRLARQAATAPWYASWIPGAVMAAAPVLLVLNGVFGANESLILWGAFAFFFFFFSCGIAFVIFWTVAVLNHRSRVRCIKRAIRDRRVWSVTGPISRADAKVVLAGGQRLRAVHRIRLPDWETSAACTVVFADPHRPEGPGRVDPAVVICINGPDGQQIYPAVGAVPMVLGLPAVIASVIIGFAFTASCNAQTQNFDAAAGRLRTIQAAQPCTSTTEKRDQCLKWVPGNYRWDGGYSTETNSAGGVVDSTCNGTLRWGNSSHDGTISTEGADCRKQFLYADEIAVEVELAGNDPVQLRIGNSLYRTDLYPPLGNAVFTLALVFRLATLLWLIWPIVHIASSVIYRLLKLGARKPAAAPSPPAPALS